MTILQFRHIIIVDTVPRFLFTVWQLLTHAVQCIKIFTEIKGTQLMSQNMYATVAALKF